ncbi:phosphoglycerate kinase [Parvularcula sp. IMCC14364]|uniref:phosphoglycerate kinase n=1 Tax=Parvularcula sp. IMCC14364 TaxID=3067902 RepID=UPI0027409850|nr:phosphoglycerate kinase [Parvularcula sp. IMCC14364]
MSFRKIDDISDIAGKRALVRVDFNVPMADGKVSDATRLERALPTIRDLVSRSAKVILLSHFGRPKGARVPEMSLAPVAEALRSLLDCEVHFAEDCIGDAAKIAVSTMRGGEVLLLENTRFHAGEEANDPAFAQELAENGDLYINDAFSAAHRAHASTEGVAHLLPAAAGRAMERELDYLAAALSAPERPMMAVVGGAKVSTKLDVLTNLIDKADYLVVGGGMANTFLLALGRTIGKSLAEPDLVAKAQEIIEKAKANACEILLPQDVVVATEFVAGAKSNAKSADDVAATEMILDLGPASVDQIAEKMERCKTLVWNGPLGAFETEPFHVATVEAARFAGKLARAGKLVAVAGGGDTVAALNQAGVADDFTYISTAGGAFLEWMEGKSLPGVEALRK